jgi:hypothetical protein
MSRKLTFFIWIFFAAAALIVTVTALAQPSPGGQPSGEPPQPPPEAVAACQGKRAGSTCRISTPRGEVSGTCGEVSGQLICMPEGGPPRPPTGR